MIKLVAFDWNGTLIADTVAIYESDNEVVKFLGLKPVSLKIFRNFFDVPVKNYYLALGAKDEQLIKNDSQISNLFHSYYQNRETNIRSRAHAIDLVSYLAKQKIDSIIISNHLKDRIEYQLDRLKLKKYFKTILATPTISTALKKRSKDKMFKDYLIESKLKPDEVLVVGDTVEEIHIARGLGIKVATITHGNCSTHRLKAAKPDYLISNLEEVTGIIEKLNR